MTLAAASPINSYVGASNANTYAFVFPIFSQGDLVVTVAAPSPSTTTYNLILGTDYTVTGLSPAGDPASTGSIVLVNSSQAWLTGGNLTTGYILTIERIVSLAQAASVRNQGDFFPEYIENALDYIMMAIQQLNLNQTTIPPTTLPVAISMGGTNSTTALANGKIMQSSSGKIVESPVGITGSVLTGLGAGAAAGQSVRFEQLSPNFFNVGGSGTQLNTNSTTFVVCGNSTVSITPKSATSLIVYIFCSTIIVTGNSGSATIFKDGVNLAGATNPLVSSTALSVIPMLLFSALISGSTTARTYDARGAITNAASNLQFGTSAVGQAYLFEIGL